MARRWVVVVVAATVLGTMAAQVGAARARVSAAGPAVISALQRSDPAALESAARAIRSFAPATREMVVPLASALRDHDRSVRLGAATLLGALGPEARAALPDLEAARE